MTMWTCDGIPKDGNVYPQAIAGGHAPIENSDPLCSLCELPRAAMEPPPNSTKTTLIVPPQGSSQTQKRNWILPMAIIATTLTAGLGGWGLIQLLIPKPEPRTEKTAESPSSKADQGDFVSEKAEHPQWFSQGEKILLDTTADKDRGAAAFAKGNWRDSIEAYEKAATDPEGKIYSQNAKARQSGKFRSIAVVVPIANDPNSAQEILRGVARYQEEFNRSNPSHLLEVVIANDEGGSDSTAIADDLIAARSVLAVMGHGIDPFSQQAIDRYETAKLAILSPLTTSVSKKKPAMLKTLSHTDTTNEVLGSYLDAVGKTLATYANQKEASPAAVIFYHADNPYSQKLATSFRKAIEGVGGKIVAEIAVNQGNFDAKTAIQQAKQDGGKVVLLALSKDGEGISQTLSISREASSLLLLGGNELYTPNLLVQGGDSIEGLILAVPWRFQATDPFAQDAIKSWRGRISWRTATAYDTTKVLADTIARHPDRTPVSQALAKGVSLTGSTTDFNVFNEVPLVRVTRGSDGPSGSHYQFDPI